MLSATQGGGGEGATGGMRASQGTFFRVLNKKDHKTK